jgi:2,4-dienoyl-CoA reductase-like NADH-dependent reductase (Old Yellow Enzyme family)
LENLPKKLTEPEIEGIIENFIKTIERTKKAGYDGVQLHAAHGWLLCHFLCGNTNVRNDKWGGSMENKFRIIERIVTGARQRVGDYPILIKINGYDTLRNGMRIPEAVQVAKLLEKVGIDAIEVSCGMPNDGFITLRSKKFPTKAALEYSYLARWLPNIIKRIAEPFVPIGVNIIVPGLKELYLFNVSAAEAIKTAVNIPVIVVGGIKNLDDIEMIIGQGQADYVAMARAFIHDPNIVNKFKEGKLKDSRCLYCNYCITCIESMPARCFYGKLPHKHKQ